jgi:hypothetical protein
MIAQVQLARLSKHMFISDLFRETVGLLQFGVLCLCLFEDGDGGVGVLPQREEILIRGARLGRVAYHCIRPAEAKTRQRADDEISHHARMIDDQLKVRHGVRASVRGEIAYAPNVRRDPRRSAASGRH